MYFKRLLIKDFGPIRNLELHFEKNKVYHFVADNDSGKSMILDAMNILCFNVPDIHVQKYVSDYAKSFYIEGEDFEGNIIAIKRGEESWYKLKRADGTEKYWDKIRGKVPEEIQKLVNMYEDDLKGEKFNFRYADDKILFMNTTAGENYSFFQKALGTDKVIMALKKANTLESKLSNKLDDTLSKINYEKEKLELNPDISYVKDEVEMFRDNVRKSFNTLKDIHSLIEMYSKLDKLNQIGIPKEIKEFDWQEAKNKLRILSLLDSLIKDLNKKSYIEKELEVSYDLINAYKLAKNNLIVIGLIRNYVLCIHNNVKINNVLKKTDELREIIDNINVLLENIADVNVKLKLNKEYLALQTSLDEVNSKVTVLSNISECYESLQDLFKAITMFSEIISLEQARLDNKNRFMDYQKRLTEYSNELDEFMKKNNFCPVVAKRLDKKCPFSTKDMVLSEGGIDD